MHEAMGSKLQTTRVSLACFAMVRTCRELWVLKHGQTWPSVRTCSYCWDHTGFYVLYFVTVNTCSGSALNLHSPWPKFACRGMLCQGFAVCGIILGGSLHRHTCLGSKFYSVFKLLVHRDSGLNNWHRLSCITALLSLRVWGAAPVLLPSFISA